MTKQVTVTEARARLGELVDEVRYRGGGVLLTKNGKSVAALVPATMFEEWKAQRDKDFAVLDRIWAANLGGDMTEEESIQLAVEVVNEVRREERASRDLQSDSTLVPIR